MRRATAIAIVSLVCLAVVLVLFGRGKAQPEPPADEPAAQRSFADQLRWLATEAGEAQAAIAAAQQYLSAQPELTMERQRVHYELAVGYWFAEDPAAALATFRDIVAVYQAAPFDRTSDEFKVDDAQFFVGRFEIDHGDRARGLEALAELITAFPESDRRPDAMWTLACQLAMDAQFEQGRAIAQALATEYTARPLEPQALHWAVAYLLSPEANPDREERARNLPAAKVHVDTLVARHPNAPETTMALENLMWHHLDRFEYGDAEPVARRIVELFPGTKSAAEAQMELAEMAAKLRDDFGTANELIDEVIAWAMEQHDVGHEAAFLLSKSRILVLELRCAEARLLAEDVIELALEHEDARPLLIWAEAQLAYAYFMDEQYVVAAGEYARIVEQYPEETTWAPFLKYYVGLSWYYAGQYEKAREACIRVVEEHPDDGWAYGAWELMEGQIPKPRWTPPAEWGVDS
jgi:TolA-binding protein